MRQRPFPQPPDHEVRARLMGGVRDESRRGRNSLFLGLLAIATFVLVAALSLYQSTAEHRATALLESGVASITDIDALIAEQLPDLRVAAREGDARDYVIPGFPIAVTLTRDEVLQGSEGDLRALLLSRAAAAVYVEGLAAFDATGEQSLPLLSAEGLLNRLLGQLTGANHSRAGLVAVVALVAAAIAGFLVVLSERTYGSVRSIAIAIAAGAFPGLLLSAAAVYAMGRIGGSDPFVDELTALLGSLFEVPQRNYLVVLVAAAVLAVVAWATERFLAPWLQPARPLDEPLVGEQSLLADWANTPALADGDPTVAEALIPRDAAGLPEEEVAG